MRTMPVAHGVRNCLVAAVGMKTTPSVSNMQNTSALALARAPSLRQRNISWVSLTTAVISIDRRFICGRRHKESIIVQLTRFGAICPDAAPVSILKIRSTGGR
jgi:hypothetical protein